MKDNTKLAKCELCNKSVLNEYLNKDNICNRCMHKVNMSRERFISKFNPSVKSFLEKNPDKTVMGLYWAGNWRFAISVYSIVLILLIITWIIAR